MVAWLSHAGTLIRAAPEHLRTATTLETGTYDILSEASLLNQKDMTGSRYVDLGAIPTAAEERTATHMQVDGPPQWMYLAILNNRQGIQVWHLDPEDRKLRPVPEKNQMENNHRTGQHLLLHRLQILHHPLRPVPNQNHK